MKIHCMINLVIPIQFHKLVPFLHILDQTRDWLTPKMRYAHFLDIYMEFTFV